jgi:hypothetical protein
MDELFVRSFRAPSPGQICSARSVHYRAAHVVVLMSSHAQAHTDIQARTQAWPERSQVGAISGRSDPCRDDLPIGLRGLCHVGICGSRGVASASPYREGSRAGEGTCSFGIGSGMLGQVDPPILHCSASSAWLTAWLTARPAQLVRSKAPFPSRPVGRLSPVSAHEPRSLRDRRRLLLLLHGGEERAVRPPCNRAPHNPDTHTTRPDPNLKWLWEVFGVKKSVRRPATPLAPLHVLFADAPEHAVLPSGTRPFSGVSRDSRSTIRDR